MAEVEAVGALNWDRILFADRFAERGEEVGLDTVEESIGGSAANTASWLSKERTVAFNGFVGDDLEGDQILRSLESAEIGTSRVVRDGGRSGAAFVISEGDERTIYVNDGVNRSPEAVPDCDLLHMASFFEYGALETQARLAGETDAAVSFAPGFLCYEAEGRLEPVLERTDILFVNEKEHLALGGLSDPVETVVVTQGEEGCLVLDSGREVEVEALEVEVVDATGAGDAFAAGFLDARLNGLGAEEAGRRGNRFAAECIARVGGFRS